MLAVLKTFFSKLIFLFSKVSNTCKWHNLKTTLVSHVKLIYGICTYCVYAELYMEKKYLQERKKEFTKKMFTQKKKRIFNISKIFSVQNYQRCLLWKARSVQN